MQITNHNKIGLSLSLLLLFNVSVFAAEKVTVTFIQPKEVKLEAGKPQDVLVKGTAFKQIKGALLSSDKAGRQVVKGLTGSFSGSDTAGRVTLTLGKGVKPGKYYVQLTDGSKPLVLLPVTASVVAASTTKQAPAKISVTFTKPKEVKLEAGKPQDVLVK